ncbi:MAG: tetratricopeptide repeat protein, partial [Planctomycetota bacterium]
MKRTMQRTRRATAAGLVLGAALTVIAPARGGEQADPWRWTRSAGWARMEGSARGAPEEQLIYAKERQARGEFYDACRQYFHLIRSWPDAPEAKEAMRLLADSLFECENYYDSFQTIEEHLRQYPKSAHRETLLQLEYRIGNRFLEGAPVSLLRERSRAGSLRAATEVFDAVLGHDEFGPFADDALLQSGRAYLELGKKEEAIRRFDTLLDRFPRSELAPLARYQRAVASGNVALALKYLETLRAAQSAGAANDQGGRLRQEVERGIEDLNTQNAQRMLKAGGFYERRSNPRGYDAAIFTYRQILERYPGTEEAARARERLQALDATERPKPDIGERTLDVPTPKLGGLTSGIKKLNPVRWFRDDERPPPPPPPGEAAGGREPAYPELDVAPPAPEIYTAGRVQIDLGREEARLHTMESGAAPPVFDTEPAAPAPRAPREAPAPVAGGTVRRVPAES